MFISVTLLLADYNATLNAQQLGLYYQDYNFLMGLTGLLTGCLFLFAMVYITVVVTTSRS
jgi:hypothetical protein